MNNRLRTKWAVTLGSLGKLPASGTIASLIALFTIAIVSYSQNVFLYFLSSFNQRNAYIMYNVFSLSIVVNSFNAIKKALPLFDEKDPSEIVLDEVVGMFVTFLFVPLNYKTLLLGFCLFRFFDISKFFGIKFLEKLPGAWGIVLDDVAAGLLANGCLQIFLYYGLV